MIHFQKMIFLKKYICLLILLSLLTYMSSYCLMSINKNKFNIDLFSISSNDYKVVNILPIENSKGTFFRWVEGPVAGIKFYTYKKLSLQLLISINSPFANQDIKIYHNGRVVDTVCCEYNGKWLTDFIDLTTNIVAVKGINEIAIRMSMWNSPDNHQFQDSRPLAFAITKLKVTQ